MSDSLRAIVRDSDYERYICSLFVKAPYREHVWAVLALGNELLRIPANVTEEMAGLVRLKWWQEQFQHLARQDGQGRQDHQILAALAPALEDGIIKLDVVDALCESLAQQCGEAITLEHARQTMQHYYILLAHAAGETGADEVYEALGDQAAIIAMIRTKCLKSEELQDAGEIITLLEPLDHHGKDTLCRKLTKHNWLWRKRIQKAVAKDDVAMLKTLPCFALQMLFS